MNNKPNKTYNRILNFFIGLTVLVIAAITHLALATATINIPSGTENFVFDAPIEISKAGDDTALYGETQSVEISGSDTYQVSDKMTESTKAGVFVTIYNKYSKSQALVKTTRMQSADSIVYRLTESVTIPAGGSVQVFMEADKAGAEFIVQPGRFTIPGLWAGLQDQIYGETTETSKLERAEAQALTQTDIDKAGQELIAKLKPQAVEELTKLLPDSITLSEDQITGEIISSETDKKIDSKVDSFKLDAKIKYNALIFDKTLLLAMAKKQLQEKLPTGIEVIEFKDDSFTYKLAEINTTEQTAVVNAHLEATVTAQPTAVNFDKNELKGKTKQQAEDYLKLQGLPDATVTLSPFWVRHVPSLSDHIKIGNGD